MLQAMRKAAGKHSHSAREPGGRTGGKPFSPPHHSPRPQTRGAQGYEAAQELPPSPDGAGREQSPPAHPRFPTGGVWERGPSTLGASTSPPSHHNPRRAAALQRCGFGECSPGCYGGTCGFPGGTPRSAWWWLCPHVEGRVPPPCPTHPGVLLPAPVPRCACPHRG